MRKLFYLFLTCLLLAGCRDNRFYLDQAEAWWRVNSDSMLYYLQKVDSASLTPEQSLDYQLFRMRASYAYLMSMEKEKLDSIFGILKHRYPRGHEWAFDVRYMQLVYYYNRLGDKKMLKIILDGQLKYAISNQGYMVERFNSHDAFWCPWQPNASANGRLILMSMWLHGKEKN